MTNERDPRAVWCGTFILPGVLCRNQAEHVTFNNADPDDFFCSCTGHLEDNQHPEWEMRPLTDAERDQWAVRWSEWEKPDFRL
jgi:hypothetical protein